jgi:chromosome segregation ATPase
LRHGNCNEGPEGQERRTRPDTHAGGRKPAAREPRNLSRVCGSSRAGDQLYAGELERVEATLTELGLPHYAWERDLQATKKHGTLTDELAKLDEAQPAAEAEAKQLAAEIPQIERRLNEARGRLNELQKVRPATQIGLAQRLQELRVNHPHLFHTVGKAIEIRMEARRKVAAQQRQTEMPKEGWLP